MRKKLTHAFCMKAKAQPDAERTIYWDTELRGFGLQVTAAGHRSYVVQYRIGKRSRRMGIDGRLGLAEARERARQLFGEVAYNRDPLAEKRKAAALQEDTFQAIAEEYFAREDKKKDGEKLRSLGQQRAVLKRLVYKRLGRMPIAIIRRSDVVKLLDHIEDERGAVMADRTLAIIRRVMNWHASRSDDFRSPIVRGMARTKASERERTRVLKDDELRALWRAAEASASPFDALVRFLLLTGARRSEAARMRWNEISGSDWHLPCERNKVGKKMKEPLIRPLSAAAMEVIERLPRIGKGEWVFTNGVVLKDGQHPIGGFSHGKSILEKASGVTGWTLHDLRRTASTLMARAGVNERHAEQCLGHVIRGMEGVYNRHDYRAERKLAYEKLSTLIEAIVHPVDNVIPLQAAQ
jgi:integrase